MWKCRKCSRPTVVAEKEQVPVEQICAECRESLWEILVPANFNDGTKISLESHKEWDAKAREISGGLSVLRSIKGQWIDPDGILFTEKMIRVRIKCTRTQIDKISDLVAAHYSQKSVMYHEVIIKHY